jgi:lipopolysaccharide-induced tumor necrosis factor-alpha factor
VLPQAPPGREHCLECGRNVTGRERLLTCPDCGSVFCSSGCFRDHREYAHQTRKRQRRRRQWREGFRCPFCGTDEPPYRSEDISAGGWVVFAVLLLFCIPLCWIGLLMKEEYRTCADCGVRLG